MAEKQDGQSVEGKPNPQTSFDVPIQSSRDEHMPIAGAKTDANKNEDAAADADIAKEIKSGEKWLIRIGIATLFINTVIGLIYWRQLGEMRKATDASEIAATAASDGFVLNRDALRTTSAGIIIPNIGFQQGAGIVNVVFENKGKGNAWDIQADYHISVISLPSQAVITSITPKTAGHRVIGPSEGPNNFAILPKYTREDLTCFDRQQEAIKVEGRFRYDNSFNKIDYQPFCLIAMIGNAIPCGDLPMRLRANSNPLGLNVPSAPPIEDCHQKH